MRIISIVALIALITTLATASVLCPRWLSDDGNTFLCNFVNHEFLSFLGVIVTITLASAANLHLEFNRIDDLSQSEAFTAARSAIKAYTVMLIVLFAGSFALVLFKPIFGIGAQQSAGFNSAAIVVVVLNILALADLTLSVFRIPADSKIIR